ncbi:MAG: hypothetical protein K0Q95_3055 [Bacteroidota bacterium]|jgi:hypothetical protein|nr:hypothetical protein [Bacteroidota bacterium]
MNKSKCFLPLIIISLLWAGMIAAISFLEAPVKFTAPSLTLQVGLDVGRHVFHAFNKVEIVFGTLLMITVLAGQMPKRIKLLSFLVAALLILECLWLLPVLDKRALAIISGNVPEGESPHVWYIIIDGLKLIALISLGVMGIKDVSKNNSSRTV